MKPNRNDICPCGSGKKFKKCCIDKDYEYKKLGNTDFIVNLTLIENETDLFYNIIESSSQFNTLDAVLDFYILLLNSADNVAKYYSLYAKCARGCSHCCNIKVSINYLEFLVISRYIKSLDNEHQKIIENNILRCKTSYPQYFNDLLCNSISCDDYRMDCIFLHDNQCLIYPIRPIVCRTWFSYSVPSLCIEDVHNITKHPDLKYLVNTLFDFSEGLQENNPDLRKYELHNFIPIWFKDFI